MIDNLPPGVSLKDVDGSTECPECGGCGEVDNPHHDLNDPESHDMKACAACGGTGLNESIRGIRP